MGRPVAERPMTKETMLLVMNEGNCWAADQRVDEE